MGEELLRNGQRSRSEHAEREHSELSSNIRHYSTLRFAVFCGYLVLVAGVAGAVFSGSPLANAETVWRRLAASVLPILTGFIGLGGSLFETRLWKYLRSFKRRAGALEEQLGYEIWSAVPEGRFVTTHRVVLTSYRLLGGIWLLLGIWLAV